MLSVLGMFRPEMDGTCKGAVHFLTLGLPNTFCSECYRVPCFLFQLGRNHQQLIPASYDVRRPPNTPRHKVCILGFPSRGRTRYADLFGSRMASTPTTDATARYPEFFVQLFIVFQQLPDARKRYAGDFRAQNIRSP